MSRAAPDIPRGVGALLARTLRVHWTTTSTFPCLIGAAVAWREGHFSPLLATAILLGVWIAHVAMELWDDVCDYRGFRDAMYADGGHVPLTRFSGGSGMLTSGAVSLKQAYILLGVLVAVYVPILGYAVHQAGPLVLALFGLGGFWIVGYGMPPLRLSARGLGELGILLCFGPLIGLGTYVTLVLAAAGFPALNGAVDLIALTLLAGVLNFAMIHVTEILDREEDLASDKRTLVVRFGPRYAVCAQLIAVLACVGLVVASAAIIPLYALALLPLAYGLREAVWFVRHWRERDRFVARVSRFPHYRVHGLTCLVLIAAAVAERIGTTGVDGAALWFGVAALLSAWPGARFYLPRVALGGAKERHACAGA